jgi:hypothetical protein
MDFKILNKFKTVKVSMPTMSYATCIDLEILIKEMMDYKIPSDAKWKELVQLGKTKYNVPGANRWSPAVTNLADPTEAQGRTNGAEEVG